MSRVTKIQIIRKIETIANKCVELGYIGHKVTPSHYKLQRMTLEALEDQLMHYSNFFIESVCESMHKYKNCSLVKIGDFDLHEVKQHIEEFDQRVEDMTKEWEQAIKETEESIKSEIAQSVGAEIGKKLIVDTYCSYYGLTKMTISYNRSFYMNIYHNGSVSVDINSNTNDLEEMQESAAYMSAFGYVLSNVSGMLEVLQKTHEQYKNFSKKVESATDEEKAYAHKALKPLVDHICSQA